VTAPTGVPGPGVHVLRNVGKTLLLVAILAALFGGLGWLVNGTRGAALFAFCSLLASSGAYVLGERALLGMLGARPIAVARDPQLRVVADRVAARLEVPPPRISVIEDGFPRAFVVGRGPRSSTLVVSRALLQATPAEELEALVAHELWHVRCRDVLAQTLAVLFAATLMESSRIGGWLSRGLLYAFAPVASAFVHLMLSPRRELVADAAAAAVSGWEPTADVLLRLDRASDLVQFEANPATEPLYTVSPFDTTDRVTRMFSTHPPLQRRVDALRSAGMAGGTQSDVPV
jgi:heat shock protein HtpX